jgi:hypothetical protein
LYQHLKIDIAQCFGEDEGLGFAPERTVDGDDPQVEGEQE